MTHDHDHGLEPQVDTDHGPRERQGDDAGHGGHDHSGGGHAGHGHASASSVAGLRGRQRRALWIALGLNAAFLVAELIGGLVFGSLALLADAAHMISDVAGLVIALIAAALATRPATRRHTYGLQRSEVLGALVNAASLLLITAWVVVEAVDRLSSPTDIDAGPVIAIGIVGLAINLISAKFLAASAGGSLNMRGAYLHMLADAAGSVAVVIAGLASLAGADIVDPIASIAISLLVLWSAWGLLRAAIGVLLEGTPEGLDPVEVEAFLGDDPEVDGVHHLHLWSLASDTPALSGHVILTGERDLHSAQQVGDRLKVALSERFGITHATLELECHSCEDPTESTGAHEHEHEQPHGSDHAR